MTQRQRNRATPLSNSTLTRHEALDLLRRRIDGAGGPTAWAAAHGLARGYVADVESARRPLGGRILAALGLRREVRFAVVETRTEGEGGEAARLLALLLPEDRRALAWLPRDGSALDRRVRGAGWRPGTGVLRRLGALGLAGPTGEGWAATVLGREAQATMEAGPHA